MKNSRFNSHVGALVMLLSEFVFGLSPQQYCEKLHSKRPTGSATSYELLNIESTDSIQSFSFDGCRCNNGKYGQSSNGMNCSGTECSSDGGSSGASMSTVSFSYKIEIYFKKECKNGNFVYKKETTKTFLNGKLPAGENLTNTSCQGTGC